MPCAVCLSSTLLAAQALPPHQCPPVMPSLPLQLEAEPELPGLRLHRPAGAAGQDDLAGAQAPPDGCHPAGPARGEPPQGLAVAQVGSAVQEPSHAQQAGLQAWRLRGCLLSPPVFSPSLLQMINYGLRGLAAYSHHAEVLVFDLAA